MQQTNTQLRDLVFAAIDDINQQRPADQRLAKSLDTPLSGGAGQLDSLGFVNFIVALEQRLDGVFTDPVSLLDDERLDPTADQFHTVRNLLAFLEALQRTPHD